MLDLCEWGRAGRTRAGPQETLVRCYNRFCPTSSRVRSLVDDVMDFIKGTWKYRDGGTDRLENMVCTDIGQSEQAQSGTGA